jgi:uncharacterized glyoxalase superfamily protein PhnB
MQIPKETLMTEPEISAGLSSPVEFGNAIPILRVASLEASLTYYVEALGFQVGWKVEGYASVRRGKASLMLSVGDQGHPGTWVWIGVDDADTLQDELRARGAVIRHPPTNYPWGSRELHVTDPDGHVLRLGADVKKGEPIGEWLDGEGHRWLPQPGGGWKSAE